MGVRSQDTVELFNLNKNESIMCFSLKEPLSGDALKEECGSTLYELTHEWRL
jgi:hypothetical protein